MSFGIEEVVKAIDRLADCTCNPAPAEAWNTEWAPVLTKGSVSIAFEIIYAAYSYAITDFVWAKGRIRLSENMPSPDAPMFLRTLPDFSPVENLSQIGRFEARYFNSLWLHATGTCVALSSEEAVEFVLSVNGWDFPVGVNPGVSQLLNSSVFEFDIVYPRMVA